MSAPLRFLGLAVIAYVGLRMASNVLALDQLALAKADPPAAGAPLMGQAADPPPIPPGWGSSPPPALPPGYAQAMAAGASPYPVLAYAPVMHPAMFSAPRQSRPIYYPVPYAAPQAAPSGSEPRPALAAPTAYFGASGYQGNVAPSLDQWPAIGTAGPFSVGGLQRTPRWGEEEGAPLDSARPKRWSFDAWALVRPPVEGVYPIDDPNSGLNPGVALGGSLGGSQAGMRLTWRPTPRLGVHMRASTALMPQGRRGQAMAGGEGALGASWQPVGAVPVRIVGERRQRLGPALGGGRNAFALFAEGGVYQQPLPLGWTLDGYGQAGVVGARSRVLFADGALAATYPLFPRLAVGGGLWGGVQPGLSRFDAGPRLSYQVSPRLRVNVDYRFRVTGTALPSSGPALTLSGGF